MRNCGKKSQRISSTKHPSNASLDTNESGLALKKALGKNQKIKK